MLQKNTLSSINNFLNISIGVDIENVSRFDKYANNRKLAEKLGVFTQKELNYCFGHKLPATHLAARFCAKEAVYKALSQANVEKIPAFSEIEIIHNQRNVPCVNFLAEGFDNRQCRLSLSHCKDTAVAFVIIMHP